MNTLKLDPRLHEFDNTQAANEYDTWFRAKVAEARQAPTVSHEAALAHFAAKRAERLEKLKHDTPA
ncbi:type II toxin-antitoxin system RelB family antitoxin [Bergeriella denitrificans]|uniref:Stability determinant n=1 Tax=Bergeriella denitrificans TaxID=494 RepID=A0A378UJR9_BERDE|nr:hypothetical protein [Bergeriella denitrificans]STZ76963.1 Uncharacterised protein [Bergeriella denitrificans]